MRLLVIGLDAVEAPLVGELMDEGLMPVMAGLAARGVSVPVEASSMCTLPGAIWQDILRGQGPGIHGDYYPVRIHTGEDKLRETDPRQHGGHYYVDHAARAGRRAIVIDQPLMPIYDAPEGVTLVSEWHVHDVVWGRATRPASLLGELEGTSGSVRTTCVTGTTPSPTRASASSSPCSTTSWP